MHSLTENKGTLTIIYSFIKYHITILKVSFSLHLKMLIDSAAVTDSGSAFQADCPPTAKERSPNFLLSPD